MNGTLFCCMALCSAVWRSVLLYCALIYCMDIKCYITIYEYMLLHLILIYKENQKCMDLQHWVQYFRICFMIIKCITLLAKLQTTIILLYSIHHYVIKFVSDIRQAGSCLRLLRFPPLIKLTIMIYNGPEILLTLALHTIPPLPPSPTIILWCYYYTWYTNCRGYRLQWYTRKFVTISMKYWRRKRKQKQNTNQK
jgi:hypothetical protein